jgi:signal transduction histidine kinase
LNSRKTRIVMLVSAALIGIVVLLFAIAIFNGRADRKESAERRFQDEATISASLIEALFGSTAPQAAEQNAKRFGDEEISQAKLDELVKRSQLSYAVVLDEQGQIIGQAKADDAVLAAIRENPRHVAAVLGGAPWQLSGITREDNAEFVAAFDTPAGRRLMIQGFPVMLLSSFVNGTLAKLPNSENEQAYVVDDRGLIIGSGSADEAPGTPAPKPGGDRVEVEAPIANSAWTVSLSQASGVLYEGIATATGPLFLIVLTLAGLTALFLLHQTMGTSARLQSAYAELERSNTDLARTNVELQRSNGELEQFASVASHDLQEPLRKVQTFGDQLERRHGANLDDEAKDYLRRMRNASSRMSVLIDDLLRFSRVTTHAKPHVPVDLARVARDVVNDLETRVAETHGTVELGRLPAVQADPTQMRQLLQNLIGNALKFHRPDVPPVVRVEPAKATRPGFAAFTVSDNGIGFEDHYQERIFRVFERLHPRDIYAGTGIGLALCRKIAERHGGSIEGEGRPGEGSTFTVMLPESRGEATPPTPFAAPEPAHV